VEITVKVLIRSLILASTLAIAPQSFADIVRIFSRATLPTRLTPYNLAPDRPLDVGLFSATIDNVATLCQLSVGNSPRTGLVAVQQRSGSGDHGGWAGNFAHDTLLVLVSGELDFANVTFVPQNQVNSHVLVSGFGTQIQCDSPGPFTAQIRAFNQTANTWTPWFTVNGNSTSAGDNSAVFIGLQSTQRNISAIQIRAKSDASISSGHWAINAPSITTAVGPIPVIATRPNTGP